MKKLLIYLLFFSISGCANYHYQGKMQANDSEGNMRDTVLYWNKTDPLVGDEKAGPANLLIGCGSMIQFNETEDGIIFRGEPGRDYLVAAQRELKEGEVCGQFIGETRFTEIEKGELKLSILCKPISDEFSVEPRIYIRANDAPYVFDITEIKEWSFFGSIPKAAEIPECQK